MQKVVVTGIGVVTPIGTGRALFWERLLRGQHGFGEVEAFDTTNYRVHVGAEVRDFDPRAWQSVRNAPEAGRATRFALAAAELALADAGLDPFHLQGRKGGVCMGTTSGEPNFIEAYSDAQKAGTPERVGGLLADRYPCHHMPAAIAAAFGLSGSAPVMVPAACAAGNYAIARAYDTIRLGRTEFMLAGGADAFSRITYTGFARLMAISPDVCRPFNRHRKGMIPGEGSGFLLLESLEHAQKRGARIYAEIAGYGLSCDAHHMTGSHPEGRGAAQAMEMALAASRIRLEDVDYISAHGTGTKSNDRNETIAVKRVFGDQAATTPISSVKSMLGHTMGAASAIEAGVCAMAIADGVIPPTMHLEEPDPECDLDYVPGEARQKPVRVAMNNAYAFGGANASLVLKQFEGGL